MVTSKIQRTSCLFHRSARHTVGIYHGRLHVAVTEQFLNSADVIIGLQKVRGKTVAEGVTGDALGKFSLTHGFIKRQLDVRFVKMIPPPLLRYLHKEIGR